MFDQRHIQKHIVKEVAQNLSVKLLEGNHGALRTGVLLERTKKILHNLATFCLLPQHFIEFRAQFLIPADGHIFLLPGESANRFGLG